MEIGNGVRRRELSVDGACLRLQTAASKQHLLKEWSTGPLTEVEQSMAESNTEPHQQSSSAEPQPETSGVAVRCLDATQVAKMQAEEVERCLYQMQRYWAVQAAWAGAAAGSFHLLGQVKLVLHFQAETGEEHGVAIARRPRLHQPAAE